jgi:hypothetical protein
MTPPERRTFFERLCAMRDAYQHGGALDRAGVTPIAEAIACAERELELIGTEADTQPQEDSNTSSQHPV